MGSKHEVITAQVAIDFSVQKRGRLYDARQGLAVPINGDVPMWFGPMPRKFKGFPDKFGFEFIDGVPVFCVVEVKTIAYSTLSKEQKIYMSYIKSIGGFAYIAMESRKEGELYFLKEFEG